MMPYNQLKVLAINSLPAHGNAGLKMVMRVLGTKVVPVPSLYLTGIGSIKGITKFELPFDKMLLEALSLARKLNEKLIVYVGYLGNAEQIYSIKKCIQEFEDIIHYTVIDPVCGDHGKAYVSNEIIRKWGELIAISDLCLPNITEVALLTENIDAYNTSNTTDYIKDFASKFKKTRLIVTSVEEGERLANYYLYKAEMHQSKHHKLTKNYGGSGDAFASYLIDYHCFQNIPLHQAMEAAGEKVRSAIAYSMEKKERFLMLNGEESI